jgi:hypothetical protein
MTNENWLVEMISSWETTGAETFDAEKYFNENTLPPSKLSHEDYITVSHRDEATGEFRAHFVKLGELGKFLTGRVKTDD